MIALPAPAPSTGPWQAPSASCLTGAARAQAVESVHELKPPRECRGRRSPSARRRGRARMAAIRWSQKQRLGLLRAWQQELREQVGADADVLRGGAAWCGLRPLAGVSGPAAPATTPPSTTASASASTCGPTSAPTLAPTSAVGPATTPASTSEPAAALTAAVTFAPAPPSASTLAVAAAATAGPLPILDAISEDSVRRPEEEVGDERPRQGELRGALGTVRRESAAQDTMPASAAIATSFPTSAPTAPPTSDLISIPDVASAPTSVPTSTWVSTPTRALAPATSAALPPAPTTASASTLTAEPVPAPTPVAPPSSAATAASGPGSYPTPVLSSAEGAGATPDGLRRRPAEEEAGGAMPPFCRTGQPAVLEREFAQRRPPLGRARPPAAAAAWEGGAASLALLTAAVLPCPATAPATVGCFVDARGCGATRAVSRAAAGVVDAVWPCEATEAGRPQEDGGGLSDDSRQSDVLQGLCFLTLADVGRVMPASRRACRAARWLVHRSGDCGMQEGGSEAGGESATSACSAW
mmetsp:Transcript_69634/g.215279  ORF Transcript_69634/g.215279 Transcript_69634/m.215279 type:complete len:528 (+) Transcript_69634:51-1634(+)